MMLYQEDVVREDHKHVLDAGNNKYWMYYELTMPMKVTSLPEFFIFDIIGMIESLGGTLGMCIGFSFSGITTNLLNLLENI